MKLEYTKYGDYYLPNIVISEESKETKGKDRKIKIKLFKRT